MDAAILSQMTDNLHAYVTGSMRGMRDNQKDALKQVDMFMHLPVGQPMTYPEGMWNGNIPTDITKKGNFFELNSATGTGKTRIMGVIAREMNVPTLILTPRNLLNKQNKKDFCEEVGIPEEDIAVYDSTQPEALLRRLRDRTHTPKYLVTSYQALPSLVNRHGIDFAHPDDAHYRPLVILDECHEAQGTVTAGIINGFLDKVLVTGFTATDAGAAKTLFRGQAPVYNLPLKKAIEDKYLCRGARTCIADVNISEKWIEDFQKTPEGKEFPRELLEKFARNPSVIEGALDFHFTPDEAWPEKERLHMGELHRLPAIFYTYGVTAAEDGMKEYNKRAKSLGLDSRAAFISGERCYFNDDGRIITDRQQILELFNRGHIQALWNDSVLEMGFDAPNATICYSLRPSRNVHTLEQQFGRVTRRPYEDYFGLFGQDKIALAVNIRAKGTNQKLFGAVIGDQAEAYERGYRPPNSALERHVRAFLAFMQTVSDREKEEFHTVLSSRVPEKTVPWAITEDEALLVGFIGEKFGKAQSPMRAFLNSFQEHLSGGNRLKKFEIEKPRPITPKVSPIKTPDVIMNVHSMQQVLADEKKRDEGFPEKTDDWLSLWDTIKLPGGGRQSVQAAAKAILDTYDAEIVGEQIISYMDQMVCVQKMQSESHQPVCICREDWPKVEKAAGVALGGTLPDKTADWLGYADITKLPGGGRQAVQTAAKTILGTYDIRAAGEQIIPYRDQKVRVQQMQARGQQPVCIHRKDWPKVEKAAGKLPDKTNDWLSLTDTEELPGGKRKSVRMTAKAILGTYHIEATGQQAVTYNGQSIRVQQMQSGGAQPICIHRKDWPKVEKAAGVESGRKLPDKTDNWLASTEIMRLPGGNRQSVQATAEAILNAYDVEASGEQTISYRDQKVRVQQLQSGTRQPTCIHRKDWPKVEKAAEMEPDSRQQLKSKPIKPRGIKPGDEGLKREDRSRE